jgi:hypothetical protein
LLRPEDPLGRASGIAAARFAAGWARWPGQAAGSTSWRSRCISRSQPKTRFEFSMVGDATNDDAMRQHRAESAACGHGGSALVPMMRRLTGVSAGRAQIAFIRPHSGASLAPSFRIPNRRGLQVMLQAARQFQADPQITAFTFIAVFGIALPAYADDTPNSVPVGSIGTTAGGSRPGCTSCASAPRSRTLGPSSRRGSCSWFVRDARRPCGVVGSRSKRSLRWVA